MKTWQLLADRTAVLFLGVAAGTAIGFAFAGGREPAPVVPPLVPEALAPPPPVTSAGPDARPVAPPVPGMDPVSIAPDAPAVPVAPGVPPAVASVPDSAVAVPPSLARTVAEGRPVRVGVYGDSFGDGVWSGLARELPQKRGYRVTKYSRQATGFTRYKSLNLETHTAQQVASDPVDIAVVSYGANDTQGVIADGHLAKYMSPAWQGLIARRAAGLVRELRDSGATVYWVGLPRMRKPAFDADITAMNAFYARLMSDLGVPFIDTRPMSSGPDGFAAYLPDSSGKPVLMRADDGVHMSMNGYVRITRGLAQRIDALVAAARARAGLPPAGSAVSPRPAEPARFDMGAPR
ncbi:GDSL-type esterase/lipase family protein [Sphingomonas arantia]|uniref:GDSL-type esterase/lipase family protein n=1 Tax=Sphingomonas arantia TaxID=1460676 RepID=A0ABW4TZM7_9SPHN